ncbi:hypothetical protein [Pseudooceanicola nanhaiensis]|uniref:hypothetical protein n=1 Tax=Pseudooceanicola nanhaiensis TaxID=375761 RepID=UPI001CD6C391|nr:hypothetical protein [Pseudooceanicola nanhaiensis]MCA0919024.1 hypothetical protein [Pseudooceanicola nanhaiensis]
MRALLAAPALLAVLAGPASALSCMRPDPASSFTRAANAAERYVIVEGRLRYNPRSMPPAPYPTDPPLERHTTGHVEGNALSKNGFDIPFSADIDMDFVCHGTWCTDNISRGEALMFLEQTDDGYRLELTPCGGWHFFEPTQAQLATVRKCIRGQACK